MWLLVFIIHCNEQLFDNITKEPDKTYNKHCYNNISHWLETLGIICCLSKLLVLSPIQWHIFLDSFSNCCSSYCWGSSCRLPNVWSTTPSWLGCEYVHYKWAWIVIINPRRMREGYSSHPLCVCLSVCYRASCYIPRLIYVESRVPLSFLCCSQRMYCVDFVENALFKSSGEICWSSLPSSLLDELDGQKRAMASFRED